MDPKDELLYKHQSDQIDREIRERYRALNTEAEIASMRRSDPDEDRLNLIAGRLGVAEMMLEKAFKDRDTAHNVIGYVENKLLKIDPGNARALMIRAIAHARLSWFVEAVKDAEAAIRADPDNDSRMSQWMRSQLPFWREEAEKSGI